MTTPKRLAMTGRQYEAYLEEQGANTVTPRFSEAANYRRFTGLESGLVTDQPLADLGITDATIEECALSAR